MTISSTLGNIYRQVVTLVIFQLINKCIPNQNMIFLFLPQVPSYHLESTMTIPLTFTMSSTEGLMKFGICEMYGIFRSGFEVDDEACERE